MFQAALAWQVYEVSGEVAALGALGLVRFVPQLLATTIAGAVADSYDRKRIVLLSQTVPALCSLALLLTTRAGVVSLPLIYGLVVAIALANAFENPARQALLPSIVRRETFQNAITVNTTFQSLAFIMGPSIAGVVIAVAGVAAAYGANIALLAVSVLAMAMLHPRPLEGERRAVTLEAMREGLRFVWRRQVLLGSMALDMFAVIFGGAQALLPVYATDILHVGSTGYGILASSMNAGALVASLVLVMLPTVQRAGLALLVSVVGFGIATIVFGLARSFPLAIAAYTLVGMSDQVSVVMRQTMVQLATPDRLRGRVTAINALFVGSSNQLGAVRAGFVAAATTPTFSVVSGGFACLGVVAVVALLLPDMRSYRIDREPDDEERASANEAARSVTPSA
jgi:MFS family permease